MFKLKDLAENLEVQFSLIARLMDQNNALDWKKSISTANLLY